MVLNDTLDLTKHELLNALVQKLAADPSTPLEGQIYYNTVSKKLRQYNGTAWIEYGTGAGAGDVTQASNSGASGRVKVSAGADKSIADYAGTAGLLKTTDANGTLATATVGTDYVTGASTNTLTNKTIDANGAGNSITNIEAADLASGVLNTNTALTGATNAQIPSALAVKTYVDTAVTGLYDDRGNYDASVNTFPASGGSGSAGAVLKGDIWRISVAGTLGGSAVQVNDTVRALVDAPAQTASNWAILQGNSEQSTTSLLGVTRYATQAEANAQTVTDAAVTPAALADYPIIQSFNFGNASATSFAITHNRGHKNVVVAIYLNSNDEEEIAKVVTTDNNTVTISGWITAPASNAYRAVVYG